MAKSKTKTRFACTACGYSTPKWMGRCPECGEWNTLEEELIEAAGARPSLSPKSISKPVPIGQIDAHGGEVRVRTGLSELDNVLGGGLVSGSITLLGGDPGVGKSTLLLMACERFASKGLPVLYVSGEESTRQIQLRAQRLGVTSDSLLVLAHTDWEHIERTAREAKPVVMVVDSVQTVAVPHLTSIPGSVGQVREVAHRAMLFAKQTGTSVLLVGHVTKQGDIAGPKVLEHFVDTVLHFEGDGRSALRVLRTVKNRFGAAGELGLFEMVDHGMRQVPDASARLLAERVADAAGTAVTAALEGSRPMLSEVQALVGPASPGNPARTCVGVDRTRVLMLAAVLGKCGIPLHDRDLFVNAAGGVRLGEPAADLAILAAASSSLLDLAVPDDVVLIGEVGLVGEVRAVSHPQLRLKEAARHGFRRVFGPRSLAAEAPEGVHVIGVRTVRELLDQLFG
ncbi:MAG: DNA repair protein RadA [Deltaproteobacteria bacterium]|nr:MAG: DNA repair protein RadA [Deltaproteobacteria bacterium]